MYYLETKKLLAKKAPTFSNQQLAAPHEHFCAKLLSDCKEFDPEIYFSLVHDIFRGWHLKIFGALGILL